MQDKKRYKIAEQGNNNITEVDGDRVFKSPNPNGVGFLEASYEKQAEQWNAYYAGTKYATASVTDDGKLSTPYIEGPHPNDQQRLAICEDMLKKGYIMLDCRDKRNFIVNQDGDIFPVDFGQIETKENRFYTVHLKVVQKELDSIRSKLNSTPSTTLRKEPNAFQAVEDYIVALEAYKATLAKDPNDTLAQDKINQINLFARDTRARISRYNQGDKHAFDGYIEANNASLKVLAKSRTTWPLVRTILLSLMVAPIIFGVIQLALTKGNSFLYVTAVTESEKRALDVQKKVIDMNVKINFFSEKESDSAEDAKKKPGTGKGFTLKS